MPNEIKALYTTGMFNMTGLNILLHSSVGYTGWMSDLVDNRSLRSQQAIAYIRLSQGTSPTSSRQANVFLIRGDTNDPMHITDGGSFSAAASPSGQGQIIVNNAPFLGVIANKSAGAATNDPVYGEFVIDQPGPYFGLAITHDFGSALNTTGNYARYTLINPEIQ